MGYELFRGQGAYLLQYLIQPLQLEQTRSDNADSADLSHG